MSLFHAPGHARCACFPDRQAPKAASTTLIPPISLQVKGQQKQRWAPTPLSTLEMQKRASQVTGFGTRRGLQHMECSKQSLSMSSHAPACQR